MFQKKCVSFILAVVIFISLLPVSATAVGGEVTNATDILPHPTVTLADAERLTTEGGEGEGAISNWVTAPAYRHDENGSLVIPLALDNGKVESRAGITEATYRQGWIVFDYDAAVEISEIFMTGWWAAGLTSFRLEYLDGETWKNTLNPAGDIILNMSAGGSGNGNQQTYVLPDPVVTTSLRMRILSHGPNNVGPVMSIILPRGRRVSNDEAGITGTAKMTLAPSYAATSTSAFTVTGEGTTVEKISGDDKIIWNSVTNKLDIEPGLAMGVYTVVLRASNGEHAEDFVFTLIVEKKLNVSRVRVNSWSTEGSDTFSESVLFDDALSNHWHSRWNGNGSGSQATGVEYFADVDLGFVKTVTRIELVKRPGSTNYGPISGARVLTHTDEDDVFPNGETMSSRTASGVDQTAIEDDFSIAGWNEAPSSVEGLSTSAMSNQTVVLTFEQPITTRYLRVGVTQHNTFIQIAEMRIFGSDNEKRLNVEGGGASPSKNLGQGSVVTLTANPAPMLKEFSEWVITPEVEFTGGTTKNDPTAMIIMPDGDVSAIAKFTLLPNAPEPITLTPLGGKTDILSENPDRGFRHEFNVSIGSGTEANEWRDGHGYFDAKFESGFDFLENEIAWYEKDNPRIAQVYFYLDKFYEQETLPESAFREMEAYIAKLKALDLRIILRFVYDNKENVEFDVDIDENGKRVISQTNQRVNAWLNEYNTAKGTNLKIGDFVPKTDNLDTLTTKYTKQAQPDIIIKHIKQLAPYVTKWWDEGMILALQFGMVGTWGEWDGTTLGNFDSKTVAVTDKNGDTLGSFPGTKAVIAAWLSNTPDELPVMARYGHVYTRITGDIKLNRPEWVARVGIHDDSIHSTYTGQTYGGPVPTAQYQQITTKTINDAEQFWGWANRMYEGGNKSIDPLHAIGYARYIHLTTYSVVHNYKERLQYLNHQAALTGSKFESPVKGASHVVRAEERQEGITFTAGEPVPYTFAIEEWKSVKITPELLSNIAAPAMLYDKDWFKDEDGNDIERNWYEYLRDYTGYYLKGLQTFVYVSGDNQVRAGLSLENYGFSAPHGLKRADLVLLKNDGTVAARQTAFSLAGLQPGTIANTDVTFFDVPGGEYRLALDLRSPLNELGARLANDIEFINGFNILASVTVGDTDPVEYTRYEKDGETAVSIVSGDKIDVEAVYIVPDGQPHSMFAALYDADGRLVNVSRCDGVLTDGLTKFNTSLVIPDDLVTIGATIKSFIWNTETFAPLRNADVFRSGD